MRRGEIKVQITGVSNLINGLSSIDTNCQRASQSLYEKKQSSLSFRSPFGTGALLAASPLARATHPTNIVLPFSPRILERLLAGLYFSANWGMIRELLVALNGDTKTPVKCSQMWWRHCSLEQSCR